MATLDQFKEFSKERKLDKAGIYVIQPQNKDVMPLKIGCIKNIASPSK